MAVLAACTGGSDHPSAPRQPATTAEISGSSDGAETTLLDVEYVDGGGSQQSLDLYGVGGEEPRPAVVLIHGGGFYSGDKADLAAAAAQYAGAGYVVAAINYPLRPELRELQERTGGGPLTQQESDQLVGALDAAVLDSRRAVDFLKQRAVSYGIDPERMATVGFSAGGSISLAHALSRDVDGVPGDEAPDVAAVVTASGALATPQLEEAGVDPPPVLVLAHESDPSSTEYPAGAICEVFRRHGGSCTFQELAGTGHEIDLGAQRDRVLAFLEGAFGR